MSIYNYKKIDQKETAKYFLLEALKYFKEDNDMSNLIAISLAGISEELTGKMLIAKGQETALQSEKKGFSAVLKILNKKEKSDKELHNFLNKAKNSTKHESEIIYLDPKSEASSILERAIKNFEKCFDIHMDEIENFMVDRHVAAEALIKRVSGSQIKEKT